MDKITMCDIDSSIRVVSKEEWKKYEAHIKRIQCPFCGLDEKQSK